MESKISPNEVSTISYAPDENVRLRNQRGCFTYLKGDFRTLDDFLRTKSDKSIVTKVVVAKDAVRECLVHLSSMDISYERLYSGVEGMAKQVWLDHLLRN